MEYPAILTNRDPEFYQTLGPFLARREIIKEIGVPLWDDDGKLWFVVREAEQVRGFASLTIGGKTAHLKAAYVLPQYRRQGIYAALLNARLVCAKEEHACTTAKVVARPIAAIALKHCGFSKVKSTINYTWMEKSLC